MILKSTQLTTVEQTSVPTDLLTKDVYKRQDQSPVLMGFLLGGIIKMICTSPLSSMALTAMLGLTGLPRCV